MRRQILAVSVLFLLSIAGRGAWGEVLYTVTDLGTLPGGTNSQANAVNASGQVVGSSDRQAVLWSGGAITTIPVPGGYSSTALGINASGQIVGGIYYEPGHIEAFSYSGSTVNTLVYATATGINDSGQIIGSYQFWTGNYDAFIWDGSQIDPNIKPNPHSTDLQGTAAAINASGQIVGTNFVMANGNVIQHAALLHIGGPPTDLGTFGGSYSSASGINASGQVVGTSDISSGIHDAFLYRDGTMVDLGTLPGGSGSQANGINASGQVVGSADVSGSYYAHAFIYSNGTMVDLNSLVDPQSMLLVNATAINDSGQIVGSGYTNGCTHAFLLSPVPEPSALVLFNIGALGLSAYSWRRRRQGA